MKNASQTERVKKTDGLTVEEECQNTVHKENNIIDIGAWNITTMRNKAKQRTMNKVE